VSRAFGNMDLKEVIIAEPECVTFPLSETDDYLILSTDGLYRSFTRQHVADRVRTLRGQNSSFTLGQIAE